MACIVVEGKGGPIHRSRGAEPETSSSGWGISLPFSCGFWYQVWGNGWFLLVWTMGTQGCIWLANLLDGSHRELLLHALAHSD